MHAASHVFESKNWATPPNGGCPENFLEIAGMSSHLFEGKNWLSLTMVSALKAFSKLQVCLPGPRSRSVPGADQDNLRLNAHRRC
jgi:hypothetical protein